MTAQPVGGAKTVIRRYGRTIANQRYVLRPGAYAILPRGRSLLLTFQQEPFWEYQLPGGGIDPGESPIAALHREVFEETGWRIAAPRRIGAFRRFIYMPEYELWAEKLCHIYVARPVRSHGPPIESGHTAVWTSADDAANILHDEASQSFILNSTVLNKFLPKVAHHIPKARQKCHPEMAGHRRILPNPRSAFQ
ncbi:MAG: NUDIX hydrolase [Paracoccaceae bacterium]